MSFSFVIVLSVLSLTALITTLESPNLSSVTIYSIVFSEMCHVVLTIQIIIVSLSI